MHLFHLVESSARYSKRFSPPTDDCIIFKQATNDNSRRLRWQGRCHLQLLLSRQNRCLECASSTPCSQPPNLQPPPGQQTTPAFPYHLARQPVWYGLRTLHPIMINCILLPNKTLSVCSYAVGPWLAPSISLSLLLFMCGWAGMCECAERWLTSSC